MKSFLSCKLRLAVLSFCVAACSASGQTLLIGSVTDPGTPQRYTVDNKVVLCNAHTANAERGKEISSNECPQRILGETLTVTGTKNKAHELSAERVIYNPVKPVRVDGTAVIEHVESFAESGVMLVQADGYRIHIDNETKRTWLEPLKDSDNITPNLWIRYSGMQQTDGTVNATIVTFSHNDLSTREQKVSHKEEFDPAAVEEKDRQSGVSEFLLGRNAKRFPASKDAAIQQRVESIGAKLVPAFQHNLSDSDATRLNFRFQVVDKEKLKDAVTLSNGIILIPQQVVERLENDSQLATVLADNIACAMEKQAFRMIPAQDVMTGTTLATVAAGVFIPGVGLAAGMGESIARSKMLKHAEEQSGRVSLSLLHDAGYDITQAPLAWWMLASKKPRSETTVPYRADYLYSQLATTWRTSLAKPQVAQK